MQTWHGLSNQNGKRVWRHFLGDIHVTSRNFYFHIHYCIVTQWHVDLDRPENKNFHASPKLAQEPLCFPEKRRKKVTTEHYSVVGLTDEPAGQARTVPHGRSQRQLGWGGLHDKSKNSKICALLLKLVSHDLPDWASFAARLFLPLSLWLMRLKLMM